MNTRPAKKISSAIRSTRCCRFFLLSQETGMTGIHAARKNRASRASNSSPRLFTCVRRLLIIKIPITVRQTPTRVADTVNIGSVRSSSVSHLSWRVLGGAAAIEPLEQQQYNESYSTAQQITHLEAGTLDDRPHSDRAYHHTRIHAGVVASQGESAHLARHGINHQGADHGKGGSHADPHDRRHGHQRQYRVAQAKGGHAIANSVSPPLTSRLRSATRLLVNL